jgi:hypothetical protein
VSYAGADPNTEAAIKKSRKHQRCNSRVASQIHLVKLDSCFQDLSMLCAKYQSSGIAGSQEEDF